MYKRHWIQQVVSLWAFNFKALSLYCSQYLLVEYGWKKPIKSKIDVMLLLLGYTILYIYTFSPGVPIDNLNKFSVKVYTYNLAYEIL